MLAQQPAGQTFQSEYTIKYIQTWVKDKMWWLIYEQCIIVVDKLIRFKLNFIKIM